MNANLPPKVRFWVYCKGLVRLTLSPGESTSWSHGEPNDEGGYRAEAYTWEYVDDPDNPHLLRTYNYAARDCDGPCSSYAEHVCPIGREEDRYNETTHLYMPAWERKIERQRDYYAERMGY